MDPTFTSVNNKRKKLTSKSFSTSRDWEVTGIEHIYIKKKEGRLIKKRIFWKNLEIF